MVGFQNGTAAMGKSMELPQKNYKIELSYDPAIPLLDISPKEFKLGSWIDTCPTMFTAISFLIAKRLK